MKKYLYIFLFLSIPIFVYSQEVKVEGKLIVDTMNVKTYLKLSGYNYFGGSDDGVIMSDLNKTGSDIFLVANGTIIFEFDKNDNNDGGFEIKDGSGTTKFKVLKNGTVVAAGKIQNVSDPVSAQDAATKAYVDLNSTETQTLSSVVALGNTANRQLKDVTDPTDAQDAATKAYVDQMSKIMLEAGLNGVVEDIDGNKYKTIKIGTQVWMAENLKTCKYNDGTPIPEVTDNTAWNNLTTPGYCWFDNDSTIYSELHGALYNFYSVVDTNTLNLCPVGWRVPKYEDWVFLEDFLIRRGYGHEGSGTDIAKSMASAYGWLKIVYHDPGTVRAIGDDLGSNNSSGFSGLGSGWRYIDGTFEFMERYGRWWSSTEVVGVLGYEIHFFYADSSDDNVYIDGDQKNYGHSVRCIRN